MHIEPILFIEMNENNNIYYNVSMINKNNMIMKTL